MKTREQHKAAQDDSLDNSPQQPASNRRGGLSECKTVFATVGTTKFDDFVDALDTEEVQAALLSRGYKKLLVQKGYGSC
jgi:hypothetical protein